MEQHPAIKREANRLSEQAKGHFEEYHGGGGEHGEVTLFFKAYSFQLAWALAMLAAGVGVGGFSEI